MMDDTWQREQYRMFVSRLQSIYLRFADADSGDYSGICYPWEATYKLSEPLPRDL